MRMRILRADCAVSFKVWTVQGTWFWSVVFPDRHSGAIGAAASEPQAVGEAQAVIKRLPQLRGDTRIPLAPGDDSRFTRPFQSSKASQFHIGSEIDGATTHFGYSGASRKRSSKMPKMGESYNNHWQLTLQQYAARVAAA
jgi:hypothetical protein